MMNAPDFRFQSGVVVSGGGVTFPVSRVGRKGNEPVATTDSFLVRIRAWSATSSKRYPMSSSCG